MVIPVVITDDHVPTIQQSGAVIGLAVLATSLLTLSNGKYSYPMAAWIAFPLLVRLLRDLPWPRVTLVGYVVCWVACYIQWSGIFPLSGPLFIAMSALLCLLTFVPFLADQFFAPRIGGLRGTLVLPAAMVMAEFLFARFGGFGAWGSVAYSQATVLPVVQVAALVGMYGVTFLIAWSASLANLVVENWRVHRASSLAALSLAGVVFAVVLVFGGSRLAAPQSSSSMIRVATVSPRTDDDANYRIRNATATQESLLDCSRQAVRAGARLIIWPEDSFFVYADDQPAWIDRAKAFTRQERVLLLASYGVQVSQDDPRYENTMVLIGPHGNLLWHYRKSRPVPGMEDLVIPGDGRIAKAVTAEGRFAGMICFDADHLEMMRQIGRDADLLLVPSDDWKQVADLHSKMIRIRAIEYGIPIVRSTLHGLSAAYD